MVVTDDWQDKVFLLQPAHIPEGSCQPIITRVFSPFLIKALVYDHQPVFCLNRCQQPSQIAYELHAGKLGSILVGQVANLHLATNFTLIVCLQGVLREGFVECTNKEDIGDGHESE